MFDDGAWIGWTLIVGGALVAIVLFGFILPIRKKVKFPPPKGKDWGKVTGVFLNLGGLFRIDCGINIPPGRTVGAIYRTPRRVYNYTRKRDPGPPPWAVDSRQRTYVYSVGNYCPHPEISDAEKVTEILFRSMRSGKTQPFPQRMGEPTHFSFNCKGGIRKDTGSIEGSVEGTLPRPLEKQKGLHPSMRDTGDQAKGNEQPLKPPIFRMLYHQKPYKEDDEQLSKHQSGHSWASVMGDRFVTRDASYEHDGTKWIKDPVRRDWGE